MGDLLTTKVKLQSRCSLSKAISLALCVASTFSLLTGCSSDSTGNDFKASIWEQLWLKGNDALSEGRLVDARRLLESAVQEARNTQHSSMRIGVTLDRLGDAYVESQMMSQAEKSYEDAYDAFSKSLKEDSRPGNQTVVLKEQLGTINELSTIWLKQNKYKKAEKILDEALAIAKKIGVADVKNVKDHMVATDYGSCLYQLGFVYENTSRKIKAQKTYERARQLVPELVDKNDSSSPLQSAMGNENSEARVEKNQTDRLNEMIRKWAPINQKGVDAMDQGDLVSAQIYFRKAYEFARTYNDTNDPMVNSLTQLLKVTNKLRQYPESKRLFLENRNLLTNGTPTKSIDNALGEVNRMFIKLTQWSEVEKILVRRVKVREILRGPINVHVAETLSELGSVYIEMKRNAQAELVLQKALKILDDSDQQDGELASKISLRLSTLKQAGK